MSKLKLFLILASALMMSCANNPNDPNNGNDTGTGGGGNGGGGNGNPSWFLTAEQQNTPFSKEVVVFKTEQGQRYRIPAIIVANNGNIVVLADDRHDHGSDIGQSTAALDIVYKISKDGGETWSDARTILPLSKPGNDGIENKGDPIVFKCLNGDLVVLAAAGGAWFAAPTKPSKIAMSRSTDNGETWSQWKEVGQNMWNEGDFANGTLQKKGFIASGRGLTTKSGKLVAAMLVAYSNGSPSNVAIYSDDNGETWKQGGIIIGSSPYGTLNEPKVIAELNDGTLVMSVRNNSQKNRLYAISKDGGLTWGTHPNGTDQRLGEWVNMHDSDVNAEGVVWTRAGEQDKNRIIHILSDGTSRRVGLGLYLSTDEASTFTQVKKIEQDTVSICYSSIEVLPDGTIACFYERNGQYNAYDLVFRRFNMKYITDEVYNADWYKDWYTTAK